MEKVYIFDGGTPNHRRKGHLCKIHWQLQTDPNYYIVKFEEEIEGWLDVEICHKDKLIEKK